MFKFIARARLNYALHSDKNPNPLQIAARTQDFIRATIGHQDIRYFKGNRATTL